MTSFDSLINNEKFTSHLGNIYLHTDEFKKFIKTRAGDSFNKKNKNILSSINDNNVISFDNMKKFIKSTDTLRCNALSNELTDITQESIYESMGVFNKHKGKHTLHKKEISYIQVWDDIWMSGNEVLEELGYSIIKDAMQNISKDYKCFLGDINKRVHEIIRESKKVVENEKLERENEHFVDTSEGTQNTQNVENEHFAVCSNIPRNAQITTPPTFNGKRLNVFKNEEREVYINRAGVISLILNSQLKSVKPIKDEMIEILSKLSLDPNADVSKSVKVTMFTPQLTKRSNHTSRSETPANHSRASSRSCLRHNDTTVGIYFLDIFTKNSKGDALYKVGHTGDITSRMNAHGKTYDNPNIIHVEYASNSTLAEKFMLEKLDRIGILESPQDINGSQKKELITIPNDMTKEYIITIMEDSANKSREDDIKLTRVYNLEMKDKEIELEKIKCSHELEMKDKDIELVNVNNERLRLEIQLKMT